MGIPKTSIMFVCTGNICRSPLAEAIFRRRAADRGVADRFEVDSSGLVSDHIGEPSDSRMRRTAAAYGVRINHRAKRFDEGAAERYHLIVVMDRGHLHHLERMIPDSVASGRVVLFRDFDPEAQGPADVPDPWYGGAEGFEQVFKIVDRSTDRLLEAVLATQEA